MCSCLHVLRIHVAYVTTGKIQISQIYTFFFGGGEPIHPFLKVLRVGCQRAQVQAGFKELTYIHAHGFNQW